MFQLKPILVKAQDDGVAVGHFNISDLVLLKAVFASARALNVPVIVGASEGERNFLGLRQAALLVKSLREDYGFPIFLNADHTHSLESAIAAAEAGFDSIVFDLSALPFEENIKQTKNAVERLKSINPAIVIEGEIGDIGSGSEIHDAVPNHPRILTTAMEAKFYVENTGVDILAPAVGNMHGMVQTMVEGSLKKRLDLRRIHEIKDATKSLLTLHGASGTDDEDLSDAIAAGINIVHINTELRVAWRNGLQLALAAQPNEIVPYKLLPSVEAAVSDVIAGRLRLFNRMKA